MGTSFFCAKILSPSDFGLWNAMQIIISYSAIVSFGIVETLVKQYPSYYSKKDYYSAKALESNVLGGIFFSSILILVAGSFWNFSGFPIGSFDSGSGTSKFVLAIATVTASVMCFSGFFYFRLIAHQNFQLTGIIDFTRTFATFSFLLLFSKFWGFVGAMIAGLIIELCVVLVSFLGGRKIFGAISPRFSFSTLVPLARVGFPIMIISWILMLQTSADRIISISLLGRAVTGYYSLGVSLVSVVLLIPISFSRMLYPKVNALIGQDHNPKTLEKFVIFPTQIITVCLPLLIGITIAASPFVYFTLLPKYHPGIFSAHILLIGCFFLSTIRNGVNYLIASNQEKLIIISIIASLSVNVGAGILFVKLGYSQVGLALSTLIANVLLSLLIWHFVLTGFGYTPGNRFNRLVSLNLPFVLLFGIFELGKLSGFPSDAHIGTLIEYAFAFIILYIGCLCIFPATRRVLLHVITKGILQKQISW